MFELGVAGIEPLGDRFWVFDAKADGHHAEMLGIVGGNQFTCNNYSGRNPSIPSKCGGFLYEAVEHEETPRMATAFVTRSSVRELPVRLCALAAAGL